MSRTTPWRLGLDIGATSIGWAAVALTRTKHGQPHRLIDAGVRIFEAGVEGDIEQGKDSSRATKRREARQPRRQNWRRQQRLKNLFKKLIELGLLPPVASTASQARVEAMQALDQELRATHLREGDHDAHQKLTYILRDKAVRQPLESFEVGRAIYALAQRRGYLSNRKSMQDDDEQDGKVAAGISEQQQGINQVSAEVGEQATLAQFYNRKVTPTDADQDRIRNRYTSRDMFRHEFARIREQQLPHQQLTDEQWDELHTLIFFQRPLKSQKHLIGSCDLVKDARRCEQCLPIFQEFRILQKVNDLRVAIGDEPVQEIGQFPEAREKLIAALQTKPKLTAKQAAKVAGLPRGAQFTLEEHEGLDLIGHRTNVKMLEAFGDRWLEMEPEQQEAIVREVYHYRKNEALKRRAMSAWGLSEVQAEVLSKTKLEQDYARHSKEALERLVERMREGTPYSTARLEEFPESFATQEIHDRLPPVKQWDDEIGNPAVIRTLTELRKVVNQLIDKYGKPTTIHIETARELKNSRKKRKEIHTRNQENRRRREKASKEILEQCGIDRPSRRDQDKWLLADECNWHCPYCNRGFGGQELVGSQAEYNVEHIYPRQYLDDSYLNKTISCRRCNARKGNQTPMQAFSGDEYQQILARVKHFKGFARDEKLRRFQTRVPDDDFVARHLNDTRYNSRLATNYLSTLYGGLYDDEMRRIVNPTGGLTWMLRNGWRLNDILSGTHEKTRDDHRHHALDAIIVACSDRKRIEDAAHAAMEAQEIGAKPFLENVAFPWNGFKKEVAEVIERINVSHRPTRTISGPLHAESIYSKPHQVEGKTEYRIRKALHKLSAKEINGEQIVDPVVRRLVQEKFAELGGKDPQKIFNDPANLPKLPNSSGDDMPIRKVRLSVSATPRSVGKGPRQRNVAAGKDSNYASMVYAVLDKNGQEKKWVHEIITRLDAAERYSHNLKQVDSRGAEKILIPDEQDGKRRFKFALRKNDMLLLEGPDGEDLLYRVQKLSKGEIQLCEHTQPTITNADRTPWNRITSMESLRKRNVRLVQVSPIGEVRIEK